MKKRSTIFPLIVAAFALLWSGCATPIGFVRGTTQNIHHALAANVLSAGEPSSWSNQVLQRSNLFEKFQSDHEAALRDLRRAYLAQATPDRLFALAELSFHHAEQAKKSEFYLAATVYAYAFLFPEDGTPQPDPLDPRRRLAADIYNLGLVRGLESSNGEEVALQDAKFDLPFGGLDLKLEASSFLWGGFRLKRFIPVGEFDIRGLRNRYRQAGIGAPLAAEIEAVESGSAGETSQKRIAPRTKVPVTAFVRIEEPRKAVVEGKIRGRLELYAADLATRLRIDGSDVPLELEPTAALAYQLEGAPVWDFEIAGFRFADQTAIFGDGLLMMHPYRRGRIPVVFVHGTASSPVRWAEMYNELLHDPILSGRYQFWVFQYNTGQPILYSALLLRRALSKIVNELDPKGTDAALQRMVIIGHSQGGLLTKIMGISSGDRFWQNLSKQPFDQVEMPPQVRELLREATFFEPVPTVRRVVFIATPHRGSFRATGFALNLIRRFVTLPGTLVSQFQALLQAQQFRELGMSQLPTSVDNMNPGHPFIRVLNEITVDPNIVAHSIIAVLGDGPITGKTDGVVAYESAHLDGVASEKVVRSGHSTQGHPETIEEVRRILREHIAAR